MLIVDDNKDGAESLAMMLRLWGHEVRIAHDGPTALRVALDWFPEAVLCDIGLPGMDGYEVAHRLRTEPGMEHALLVAVSGYSEPEHQQKALGAGFAAHLAKPVNLEVLANMLSQIKS